MAETEGVENALVCTLLIQKRPTDQDRLGTHIENVEKRGDFCRAARFSGPSNLALLKKQHSASQQPSLVLYVSDMANNAIRVVTIPSDGDGNSHKAAVTVTTLKVHQQRGDDDDPRGLRMPSGISLGVVASKSALFVADYMGGVVKQYVGLDGDKADDLVAIAGSGAIGYADGAGAAASFHGVKAVAWNAASGSLLASDFFNHRIRTLVPPSTTSSGLHVVATPATAGAAAVSRRVNTTLAHQNVAGYPGDDPLLLPARTNIRVMVWTGHSGPCELI